MSNLIVYRHETGCCLSCYHAHEKLSYPFVVWCNHTRRVVLVRAVHEWESWKLQPDELLSIAQRQAA